MINTYFQTFTLNDIDILQLKLTAVHYIIEVAQSGINSKNICLLWRIWMQAWDHIFPWFICCCILQNLKTLSPFGMHELFFPISLKKIKGGGSFSCNTFFSQQACRYNISIINRMAPFLAKPTFSLKRPMKMDLTMLCLISKEDCCIFCKNTK